MHHTIDMYVFWHFLWCANPQIINVKRERERENYLKTINKQIDDLRLYWTWAAAVQLNQQPICCYHLTQWRSIRDNQIKESENLMKNNVIF